MNRRGFFGFLRDLAATACLAHPLSKVLASLPKVWAPGFYVQFARMIPRDESVRFISESDRLPLPPFRRYEFEIVRLPEREWLGMSDEEKEALGYDGEGVSLIQQF